jgi:hypothetical protein
LLRHGVVSRAAGFVLLAFMVAGTSCAHGRLVPADDADRLPDAPGAAVAVAGGVRIVANLSDARGLGRELPAGLTPIEIRVVNHSDRPVTILYERFTLEAPKGRRYRVVPAIPLDHASLLAGMGPVRPVFATSRFQVAPRYHDIYPQLEAWPTPLSRDASFSRDAGERWTGQAPAREVCRMELPEGVLGPEGEITGYLYFEDPTRSEKALVLDAELLADQGGAAPTSLKIPLKVE